MAVVWRRARTSCSPSGLGSCTRNTLCYASWVVGFIALASPPHVVSQRREVDIESAEKQASRSQTYNKWQAHSARVRTEIGVSPDFSPWTTKAGIHLHGLPRSCPRLIDLIDVGYADVLKKNAQLPADQRLSEGDLCKGLVVDCSQAVQRRPWAHQVRTLHQIRCCIRTSSTAW